MFKGKKRFRDDEKIIELSFDEYLKYPFNARLVMLKDKPNRGVKKHGKNLVSKGSSNKD